MQLRFLSMAILNQRGAGAPKLVEVARSQLICTPHKETHVCLCTLPLPRLLAHCSKEELFQQ